MYQCSLKLLQNPCMQHVRSIYGIVLQLCSKAVVTLQKWTVDFAL